MKLQGEILNLVLRKRRLGWSQSTSNQQNVGGGGPSFSLVFIVCLRTIRYCTF